MSKTKTAPPGDPRMWRRLLARTHPDAGGDHGLFIWARELQESLGKRDAGSERHARVTLAALREAQARAEVAEARVKHLEARLKEYEVWNAQDEGDAEEPKRIPFDTSMGFEWLTQRAVGVGSQQEGTFRVLLAYLRDCKHLDRLAAEERRGASYKMLAAIGHQVGMSKEQRVEWYCLAESIPLSERHARHILETLNHPNPRPP